MDLPINDKELNTIVSVLRLGGDAALYQKLKIIKEIREENPGGAYKKIAREQYPGSAYKKIAREQFGFVI